MLICWAMFPAPRPEPQPAKYIQAPGAKAPFNAPAMSVPSVPRIFVPVESIVIKSSPKDCMVQHACPLIVIPEIDPAALVSAPISCPMLGELNVPYVTVVPFV